MRQIITQESLRKYHRLYAREQLIKMRRAALRTKLLQLHQKGAEVEAGAFDLSVTTHESVRLSWSKVTKALDEEICDWLRETIPATVTTYLSVKEKRLAKKRLPKKRAPFFGDW
jgi:hypothetical protein